MTDGVSRIRWRESLNPWSASLHPLHVTPKPCRLHRHPDHHFRSLLAQFGLTPKSKRGLAASEAGEAVDPLDEL